MSTMHFWPLGALLTALVLSGGCQWVPKNQFTAAQSQNRTLAEQNKALLAENENLKAHSQKIVNQMIDAEKQLAQLDAEAGMNRRRLANYSQEREAMQEQFDGLIRGGGVPAGFSGRLAELAKRYPNLNYDPQTGISKLDTDVLFDEGEASLKPESEKMLREFAQLFRAPDARELKVMVVGHTDNQPGKKPVREQYPSNWHLSTARSLAVADFLKKNGMPEQNMGVAGFGQHQPLTANATAMDRQRNRRVEIFVTGPTTPIVGWTETIPNLY